MKTRLNTFFSKLSIVTLLAVMYSASTVLAQQGVQNGEWHSFGGDPGNTQYTPLDQISKDNFSDLEIAFRWESISTKVAKEKPNLQVGRFMATPLMVDGLLYVSTCFGQVAAVDAGSGETVWEYDPKTYETLRRPANLGWQHRGVTYWDDGGDGRILIAVHNLRLICLNAKTGRLVRTFGDGGIVDLSKSLGRPVTPRVISHSSQVAVSGDTIIVGHVVGDGVAVKEGAPGHVRGFDAKTGELRWTFHTIPQDGEFGNNTWLEGSWKYTGAANQWTQMAVDDELGYVYLSTGTPTSDFYGGHRLGGNLFAESLVCLNAETGKRVWHFQAVHHGLWDYDFPSAANLMDITVDGKQIKALAQISKQAFTYVLDRETGEPVWPIEEREVPPSKVPGESASKTQPYPTKPPAYDRQEVTEDDLINFTPELRAEAIEIMKGYAPPKLFTPPALEGEHKPVAFVPGDGGGANWTGAGVDPETGRLFVPSMSRLAVFTLQKPDGSRSNLDYVPSRWSDSVPGPQGLPVLKPPYSRITGIDMNKGEHVWMQPHGDGPKNHPALAGLDLPALGALRFPVGGPLVTKTLLFVAKGGRGGDDSHSAKHISVYDKSTGEYLGAIPLPMPIQGNPISYLHKGKQYIAACGGGVSFFGDYSKPELIVMSLP
jgi:quinoprotein glucose dehydrogenase